MTMSGSCSTIRSAKRQSPFQTSKVIMDGWKLSRRRFQSISAGCRKNTNGLGLRPSARWSECGKRRTELTAETAYYLLSTALPPERLNQVIRQHWGVENSLHWRLKLIMSEDQDCTRMGSGAHNLAILRHMALNAMQKGRIERILAWQIQTRKMGRQLPIQTSGDVLKCYCPAFSGRAP